MTEKVQDGKSVKEEIREKIAHLVTCHAEECDISQVECLQGKSCEDCITDQILALFPPELLEAWEKREELGGKLAVIKTTTQIQESLLHIRFIDKQAVLWMEGEKP